MEEDSRNKTQGRAGNAGQIKEWGGSNEERPIQTNEGAGRGGQVNEKSIRKRIKKNGIGLIKQIEIIQINEWCQQFEGAILEKQHDDKAVEGGRDDEERVDQGDDKETEDGRKWKKRNGK